MRPAGVESQKGMGQWKKRRVSWIKIPLDTDGGEVGVEGAGEMKKVRYG